MKIKKLPHLGIVVPTPLSSSPPRHHPDPPPFALLLPPQSLKDTDKEAAEKPTVSESVKGSKQTDSRYAEDLTHRGDANACPNQTMSVCVCM